jgi:CheY-like chemotaxis protein
MISNANMAKRILIADDSVTMQKAFAMTFAAEGVTVVAARSADEGLALARQARPDLVFADIAMPGRSGYELCQSLKADPAMRGVPVFILGSVHTPADEGRVRLCGADGHTLKPFDSTAMIQFALDALARASSSALPEPLAGAMPLVDVPQFTIDPDSATMRVPADEADIDDYGEIAIEDSEGELAPTAVPGPSPAPAAASRARGEDMVTPPPEALPVLTPRPPPVVMRPAAAAPPPMSPPAAAASASMSPTAAPGANSAAMSGANSGSMAGGMRPSLIPGFKLGALPTGGVRAPLPGATTSPPATRVAAALPATTAAPVGSPAINSATPGAARGPAPPVPAATPASARTLVGLPAVTAQPPPRPTGMPIRPAATASAAGALPGVTAGVTAGVTDGTARPAASSSASVASVVASKVDQKMAAIAARGPEYEAIAKLSREIIERVVWEVVPQLAEAIVREELAKRGRL